MYLDAKYAMSAITGLVSYAGVHYFRSMPCVTLVSWKIVTWLKISKLHWKVEES
jgi:hypothetical protein